MAVIKNTPLWINLDADERSLQPQEMQDALNIRTFKGSGENYFLVKNVEGNTEVTFTLPAGDNTVVGFCRHEEKNDSYHFVHNTSGNHGIYKYNTVTGSITKIIVSSLFAFNKRYMVKAFAYTSNDPNQVLLYFTDGINPPRKINVFKALKHTQGDFSQGYPSTLTEEYISWVKYAPDDIPSWEFGTDTSRAYNNLRTSAFQFRYRYLYDDGEASAYSSASTLAVSDTQTQNNAFQSSNLPNQNNYIDVTISNGSPICKRIEVIARDGNDGEWKKIKELVNNPNQTTQSFRFANDGNYPVVPPSDSNKLFDAVPLTAKSTTNKDSRPHLANVSWGYAAGDNFLPNASSDANCTIVPNYHNRIDPEGTNISATFAGLGYGFPGAAGYTFDFSGYTPVTGDYIIMDFSVQLVYINAFPPPPSVQTVGSFRAEYVVQPTDTVADIISYFAGVFQSDISDKVQIVYTNAGATTLGLSFKIRLSNTEYRDVNISYITNASKRFTGLASYPSVKSGSRSEYGIVYYDDAHRSNTVTKLKDVYVKWFGERANDTDINFEGIGHTTLDLRLKFTPPIWAKTYQIVRTKSTIDSFLQYSCARAYNKTSGAATALDNRIYLSFRTFKGKDESYKERLGADIDYNFVEGDRLRIISYFDPDIGELVYPNGVIDFPIVGFEYYEADEDTNPVYQATNTTTQYLTTGWFLILERPTLTGWSDITDGTGYWYNSGAGGGESAVFEIYRQAKTSEEEVYVEFGEVFEIGNPGSSNRYHKAQRDQTSSATYAVEAVSQADGWIEVDNVDRPYFYGDILNFSGATILGNYTIKSIIYDDSSGFWKIYINEPLPSNNFVDYGNVQLAELAAAAEITNGDVWFKPREILLGNSISTTNGQLRMVEDYWFNDFYKSNYWSQGRPNAFDPDAKTITQKASIWYGGAYYTDTRLNNMSSFDLSLAPYKDLDQSFGSIQRIETQGDSILVFYEDKTGRIPVGKSYLSTADDGTLTALSNNIYGEVVYYTGDYGVCTMPEAVDDYHGSWYFVDIKRGKVLRLSNDGLTPISDYGVDSWVNNRSREYLRILNYVRVFGGVDAENEQYIFTIPDSSVRGISFVEIGDTQFPITGVTTDATNIYIDCTIVPSDNPGIRDWDNETRTWEEICESWDNWGYPYVDYDEFAQDATVYVFPEDYVLKPSNQALLMRVVIDGTEYFLQGTLDYVNSQITIPKDQTCAGIELTVTDVTDVTGFTLGFSEPANKWVSFYSFQPEFYGYLNSEFFTFNQGVMWLHNNNATRNNFYGQQYDSVVEVVANADPSGVKVLEASSIEGTYPWSVSITGLMGPDTVSTSIASSLFDKKEGNWYAQVPMAITGSTDSLVFGIGNISSIASSTITIIGFNISGSGISLGDTVYKNGVAIGTITAIPSASSLTLSSVAGLSNNDFVYVQKSAVVEGDKMRGYVFVSRLTSSETSAVELYAFNSWVKQSNLHNNQ